MTDIQFYFVVLIDIFYYGRGLGHTFGVRVQGVRPAFGRLVQRVQRVVVAADAADYKKGRGWRRGLCRKVVKGKVLRMDRPRGRRVLKFDGAFGPEGGGIALSGDEYKVDVTGLAFCITWHAKHSVIGSLRSPPLSRCAGLPPQAGAEQPVLSVEPLYEKIALRSFIVPPLAGERWWRQPPKGGRWSGT